MHVDAIETARMSIYLNSALAGFAVDEFWGDGARFRVAGTAFAGDPIRWLATRKECRGFKTRMRVGKVEPRLPPWTQATHWVLKVLTAEGEEAWRPAYQIKGEPKRWLVTYNPETQGEDVKLRKRDLCELADELASVLKALISLTGSRIPGWRNAFIDLQAKLEGPQVAQLTPAVPREVLTELPARLVATALAANIFNGMGNWGDNIYDPDIQPAVEELTGRLFTLLAEGLQHAVDSTISLRS